MKLYTRIFLTSQFSFFKELALQKAPNFLKLGVENK